MGLIQQIPSVVSNSYVMSASQWFRVAAADANPALGAVLHGFGDSILESISFIGKCSSDLYFPGSYEVIRVIVTSPSEGAAVDFWMLDTADNPILFDTENVGSHLAFESTRFPVGTLTDKWVHVFFSIDLNSVNGRTPISLIDIQNNTLNLSDPAFMPTYNLYVNGINRLSTTHEAIYSCGETSFSPNRGQSFLNDGIKTNLTASHLNGDSLRYQMHNWQIGIAGFDFGVPIPDVDMYPTHPRIDFAETKIWFGTYIDPAIHINKFISTTGRAVDPSVAISAFGTPDYHFRRKSASGIQFSTTLGTAAGTIQQVGTITDFSPGVP
jgi:hypothetical protein